MAVARLQLPVHGDDRQTQLVVDVTAVARGGDDAVRVVQHHELDEFCFLVGPGAVAPHALCAAEHEPVAVTGGLLLHRLSQLGEEGVEDAGHNEADDLGGFVVQSPGHRIGLEIQLCDDPFDFLPTRLSHIALVEVPGDGGDGDPCFFATSCMVAMAAPFV